VFKARSIVACTCYLALLACDGSSPGLVDGGVDSSGEPPDAAWPDSTTPDAAPVEDLVQPLPDATVDQVPTPVADAYVPTGPFGCFDPSQVGSSLGQVGNITIYTGCSGTPGEYLLVWGGASKTLSQQDLSSIKNNHSSGLLGINGVWGAGISSCCGSPLTSVCISLYVSANTLTLQQLAHELNLVLAGETTCFGITADLPGPSKPRCVPTATEPCEPLPYCKQKTWPGCANAPSFQPGAARKPTLAPGSAIYGLELPQTAGECQHDGECVQAGCGNGCVAYTAPTMPGTCPWIPQLTNSFCGCVSGSCVWFEQI
jgi:hypothetical protein